MFYPTILISIVFWCGLLVTIFELETSVRKSDSHSDERRGTTYQQALNLLQRNLGKWIQREDKRSRETFGFYLQLTGFYTESEISWSAMYIPSNSLQGLFAFHYRSLPWFAGVVCPCSPARSSTGLHHVNWLRLITLVQGPNFVPSGTSNFSRLLLFIRRWLSG